LKYLHPSHQRDTAHRPIGTGRQGARRRLGYRGEQTGHLRDWSGHHFRARRQNSSLQPRVRAQRYHERDESVGGALLRAPATIRAILAKATRKGRLSRFGRHFAGKSDVLFEASKEPMEIAHGAKPTLGRICQHIATR
jgi:hypothetical protein